MKKKEKKKIKEIERRGEEKKKGEHNTVDLS